MESVFSHTQDAITRSSNEPSPRISIICSPSPPASALHSARGLTGFSIISSLCSHGPFQIHLKDLQTNYTSSLFLKKNMHKEQWLWLLNPSAHRHQLVLIGFMFLMDLVVKNTLQQSRMHFTRATHL